MDELLKIAMQFGASGLIVLACFWYILHKDKERKEEILRTDQEHKEERKELTDALQRQHKEAMEMGNKNVNVLSEISTLIKNNRR